MLLSGRTKLIVKFIKHLPRDFPVIRSMLWTSNSVFALFRCATERSHTQANTLCARSQTPNVVVYWAFDTYVATVRLHTKQSESNESHQHSVTLLTSCRTPLEHTRQPWYREVVVYRSLRVAFHRKDHRVFLRSWNSLFCEHIINKTKQNFKK